MSRVPDLHNSSKLCIICEGQEEEEYFNRLLSLNVWSDTYEFHIINAKSASNIPARFQDAYQNDRYELVIVFCDTDKEPFREYSQIKNKINQYLNKRKAAEKLIIFANPCTMQIVLSHFGDAHLKNQGKKTNAAVIEKWTGVKDYDGHVDQIKAICNKIFQRSYEEMKQRVARIDFLDTVPGSTNFIQFLNRFENDDTSWISSIKKYLWACD